MIYGKFVVESNDGMIITYVDNVHRVDIEDYTFEYFLNGELTTIDDIDKVVEIKFIDGEDVEEVMYEYFEHECDGCGECELDEIFINSICLKKLI